MASQEPDLSLRHRTFGESFQLAVNVLRAQLVPLCGALAFLVAPLQILRLIRTCFAPDMPSDDMDMHMHPHEPSVSDQVIFFVILFVYLLVALAAAAAMWPVCVHVVCCHFLKEAASTKAAIQASGRVVLRVIATTFSALLAQLGIILLMILIMLAMTAGPFKQLFFTAVQQAMDVSQPILRLPSDQNRASSDPDHAEPTGDLSALGFFVTILLLFFSAALFVILYIQWSFANIIACVEPHYWGFSALWRSTRLSKGHLGQIFLAYIMIWVIGFPYRIIESMLELGQMTFDKGPSRNWGLLPLIIIGAAVVIALHVVLQAFTSILFTILYFSGRALRDSKEGSNSFNENALSSFVHGGMEIDAGTELGCRPVKPEEEKLMPPGSVPE